MAGRRDAPHLISFEGIDGAGKSTLITAVGAKLLGQGFDVYTTREETTTWRGEAVRRQIAERGDPFATLFLFLADRAAHLEELAPAFDRGTVVLTDRYHDSTRAYQSVTLADRVGGVEAFEAWLAAIAAPWYVPPMKTYLLDLDPAVAMARMGGRADLTPYERIEFLERVRAQYLRIAEAEPERVVVLDAACKISVLVEAVMADLATSPLLAKA